jgi:uridine kinase
VRTPAQDSAYNQSMQVVGELDSGSINRLGKQGIFIVGLDGPSGSGKSTVAKRVGSRLKGHVLSMESYSIVMNDLPLEERAKQNYDAPHAIDVKLLESHIRDYVAGRAIEAPICDFAKHLRVSDRTEHIPATSLLIVEGILALHFAQLRQHFDISIYLEAPDAVCFHRRKVRDITERQRTLEFIQSKYRGQSVTSGAAVRAAQQTLRQPRETLIKLSAFHSWSS